MRPVVGGQTGAPAAVSGVSGERRPRSARRRVPLGASAAEAERAMEPSLREARRSEPLGRRPGRLAENDPALVRRPRLGSCGPHAAPASRSARRGAWAPAVACGGRSPRGARPVLGDITNAVQARPGGAGAAIS